jgi:magnesium-transporting ATPase (P-type)
MENRQQTDRAAWWLEPDSGTGQDGLTQAEARLQQHGPNRFSDHHAPPAWHQLLEHFRNPVAQIVPGDIVPLAAGVALLLPHTALGTYFGFTPSPAMFYPVLALTVAAYLLLVERIKRRFFGHWRPALARATGRS